MSAASLAPNEYSSKTIGIANIFLDAYPTLVDSWICEANYMATEYPDQCEAQGDFDTMRRANLASNLKHKLTEAFEESGDGGLLPDLDINFDDVAAFILDREAVPPVESLSVPGPHDSYMAGSGHFSQTN